MAESTSAIRHDFNRIRGTKIIQGHDSNRHENANIYRRTEKLTGKVGLLCREESEQGMGLGSVMPVIRFISKSIYFSKVEKRSERLVVIKRGDDRLFYILSATLT